jgi:hypothetical protein
MDARPRTAARRCFEFVAHSERRRIGLVVGIPALFVVLFEAIANFGVLLLFLATGFGVFLYTRGTAQETVAASAYGERCWSASSSSYCT